MVMYVCRITAPLPESAQLLQMIDMAKKKANWKKGQTFQKTFKGMCYTYQIYAQGKFS